MKGWRTVGWNTIIAVLALMEATNFTSMGFDAQTGAWLVFGAMVVNVILRAVTSTPIGRSS